MPIFAVPIAEIAQLVEHDLAKVGVASSSLVLAQLVEHDLAKVGVASSSLVFRSRFSLASVGLFSYISVCYATLTWL